MNADPIRDIQRGTMNHDMDFMTEVAEARCQRTTHKSGAAEQEHSRFVDHRHMDMRSLYTSK